MRTVLYYTVLAVSLCTLGLAAIAVVRGDGGQAGEYAFMFLTGGGFLVLHESTASKEEEILSRTLSSS